MPGTAREFGIIGLGRIGGSIALQALEKGFRIVGHDRREPNGALRSAGIEWTARIEELGDKLTPPRIVFLWVPAGAAVDSLLDRLLTVLEPGDTVVDGGNSYWGDSIGRHRRMAEQRLAFADVGTSGGVAGARNGACFM